MKKYFIKKGKAVTSTIGVRADGDEITEKMFSSPEVFQNVISKTEIVEVRDEVIEIVVQEVKKEAPKVDEIELPAFEDEEESASDEEPAQDSGAKKKK